MTNFWDAFSNSGEYVTFTDIGDTVSGVITSIRTHTFDDGKVVPQLELDTADGPKTLTAGQIRLKMELVEKRPQVGERITVTMTGIEKRPGGKTMKKFDVILGAAATPTPVRLADQIKSDKARAAAQPAPVLTDDPPF
jgi:hypothetical protein